MGWASLGLLGSLATVSACGSSKAAPDGSLTREELMDPETCRGCHPGHYREWASSMHAYAAEDPVFWAMNQRGQRETNGELGTFCVDCHAPMAVRELEDWDGRNQESIPRHLRGVTCYFCHNATQVGEHFNNDVVLANDTTMRGGIVNPVRPTAHDVAHSSLHDRNDPDSTTLCGGCHDIVTPAGVQLERTFIEYQDSLFSSTEGFESCTGCHMHGRPGLAAADPTVNVPERTVHEHLFAGVDLALSDFPDRELQRRAVECELGLSSQVRSVTHDGFGGFRVSVETNAGHSQPSGAAQDRRLWIEFIAYDADDSVVFESGKVSDDEVVDPAIDAPGYDRNLQVFRDWIYDADGAPVHQFWQAAPSDVFAEGYRSLLLPAPAAPLEPHSLTVSYQLDPSNLPSRVTVKLRLRPLGLEVVDDLIESGDLEASVREQIPTFTLHGAAVEWSAEDPNSLRSLWPEDLTCPDAYRCLLAGDDACDE